MDGGDDDEPSIQDRLWRTLRFDWSLWSPVTSPTAPTTSSTVAPVPSRSDNDDPDRPQLDRQVVRSPSRLLMPACGDTRSPVGRPP